MPVSQLCLVFLHLSGLSLHFKDYVVVNGVTARLPSTMRRAKKRNLSEAFPETMSSVSSRWPVVSVRPYVRDSPGPTVPAACVSRPCYNGGSCLEAPHRPRKYICLCPAGFRTIEGSDCRTPCPTGFFGPKCLLECEGCNPRLCDPHRGCSVCMEGFRSPPLCDKLDCSSSSNPCMNYGYCFPGDNKCKCRPDFTGTLCETPIVPDRNKTALCEADTFLYLHCQNFGQCYVYYKGPSGFGSFCRCPSEYTGQLCTETCKDKTQTCMHGICTQLDGGMKCECDPGWRGDTCDTMCHFAHWGPDCERTCGHCKVSFVSCDPVSGHCDSHGCDENWEGDLCDKWREPFNETAIRYHKNLLRVVLEVNGIRNRENMEGINPWEGMELLKSETLQWVIEETAASVKITPDEIQAEILHLTTLAREMKRNPDEYLRKKRQALGTEIDGVEVFIDMKLPPESKKSPDLGKVITSALRKNAKNLEMRLPNVRLNLKETTAVEITKYDVYHDPATVYSGEDGRQSMLRSVGIASGLICLFLAVAMVISVIFMRKQTRSLQASVRRESKIRKYDGMSSTVNVTKKMMANSTRIWEQTNHLPSTISTKRAT